MKDMKGQNAHTRRLLERRRRAAEQFPPLEQLLRGTLGQRYVRCGKPSCHCRKGRGHGPVRYLTVSLGVGRTQQVMVSKEDFKNARQHVRNYQRLWQLLEWISAINRELLQRRVLPPAGPPRAGPWPGRPSTDKRRGR